MKKILCIMLLVASIGAICVGCGNKSEKVNTEKSVADQNGKEEEPEKKAEEVDFDLGDSGVFIEIEKDHVNYKGHYKMYDSYKEDFSKFEKKMKNLSDDVDNLEYNKKEEYVEVICDGKIDSSPTSYNIQQIPASYYSKHKNDSSLKAYIESLSLRKYGKGDINDYEEMTIDEFRNNDKLVLILVDATRQAYIKVDGKILFASTSVSQQKYISDSIVYYEKAESNDIESNYIMYEVEYELQND